MADRHVVEELRGTSAPRQLSCLCTLLGLINVDILPSGVDNVSDLSFPDVEVVSLPSSE